MISFEITYCLPPKTTFRRLKSHLNRVIHSIFKWPKWLKIGLGIQVKFNMHCVASQSSDTAISYTIYNIYWNNQPLFGIYCGNPSIYLIWIMTEFTPKWIQQHGSGISKYAPQKYIFIVACSCWRDIDFCRIHARSSLIVIGSNTSDKLFWKQEIMASLHEHQEYKVNCMQQTHDECLDIYRSPPHSPKVSSQNPHISTRSSRVGCVTDHLWDHEFHSESYV